MLKLISGSLVGGANYNEIYLDPDEEDAFNSCSTDDTDTARYPPHFWRERIPILGMEFLGRNTPSIIAGT